MTLSKRTGDGDAVKVEVRTGIMVGTVEKIKV